MIFVRFVFLCVKRIVSVGCFFRIVIMVVIIFL